MTVTSFASDVRTWAGRRPDATALTVIAAGEVETRWTWAELDAASDRAALALERLGVGPGARVAHLGRNRADYVALLYGTSKRRATLVGLNWRLTHRELEPLLRDAAPAVIAVDGEFAATIEQAVDAAGISTTVVRADDVESWAGTEAGAAPTLEPAADDVALTFYTSGTTGVPKGVLLTVGAIQANVDRETPWTMDPDSNVLVCSPVFHTAGTGWIYLPLHFGAHCVLMRDPVPGQILATLEAQRITEALLVPAVIGAVVADPAIDSTDVSALRTLAYGASPISPTLLARSIDALPCEFVQAYGMTETGGPITYLRPEDHDVDGRPERLASAGRPPAGIEVKVIDIADGADCAPGERGEVVTRSDQQMAGYLNNPDATAATVDAEGWLHTGDAGYLDADGYLFLTDRLKDVIVSGAENVYPVEVENALTEHPAVAEAAVIGIPHERWGETVSAVVVRAPGTDVDEAELIEWCRDRLAHYKAPTSVAFADELPRNPAGKVLRRVLREPHWAGQGRTVG